METWIFEVIVAAFVIGAAVYVYAYVKITKTAAMQGITEPTKIAVYRNSIIKLPTQLIAGLVAVVPIIWPIWSGIATFKQTADQAANQQFFSAAQMAVTGRGDSKDANANAGADDLKVAANYALVKIVLANPEYCDMVTSIMLSQIRASKPTGLKPPRVSESISAAVLVLGEIPPCMPGRKVRLTDQYLAGANFGYSKYFSGADLRNTKLWGAYFGWADLDGAQFDGAGMADSEAGGVEFTEAIQKPSWDYMKYNYIVNFENSTLRNAHFMNTSVDGASFKNADLYCADFTNTRISRANFAGAKHLNSIVLTNACFEAGPKNMPAGLLDSQIKEILKNRKDCANLKSTLPTKKPTPQNNAMAPLACSNRE